jgi:hypothetical protein
MLVERIRAFTEGARSFEVGTQGKMHGPHVFWRWPKSAAIVCFVASAALVCVRGRDGHVSIYEHQSRFKRRWFVR